MSQTNWSDVGVSEHLPGGTVTLLLADVEGSTRLWETDSEEMSFAVARLDAAVAEATAAHNGARPVEQGEGDSFVIAFARASDAVACALQLQSAPLAPIRLRIGLHTGEVQLRDEGNYIGPTINRTARLRDLAHGGQTVLSGITGDLVLDRLPEGAFLADLGAHPLRDLPRPERVMQLCHSDLQNEFPALRTSKTVEETHFPVQLTSFIGRETESVEMASLLTNQRLVTLTGAGGVGKTRLAIQLATQLAPEFGDGAWYVDLAPITDPDVVSMTVIRALGLSDQPGRSTMETLTRFIADRRMLIVLDNCEHLLDAAADLVTGLLSHCQRLTLLATSREPISVPGEVTWRVPSLPRRRGRGTVRRPSTIGQARFSRHSRQRGVGGRDLPSTRRHAAGHRTRGRAGTSPNPRRDSRRPTRPLHAADRRCTHRGTPPTDPTRLGRLVPRAALGQ